MDHASERIAQDINAIVQTRMAMAEKLGAIEQHVGTTLHHARSRLVNHRFARAHGASQQLYLIFHQYIFASLDSV